MNESYKKVVDAFVKHFNASTELKRCSIDYIADMVDELGKIDISNVITPAFVQYDGGIMGADAFNPSSKVLCVYREWLNKGTKLEMHSLCIDIENAKCYSLLECDSLELCAIATAIYDAVQDEN